VEGSGRGLIWNITPPFVFS